MNLRNFFVSAFLSFVPLSVVAQGLTASTNLFPYLTPPTAQETNGIFETPLEIQKMIEEQRKELAEKFDSLEKIFEITDVKQIPAIAESIAQTKISMRMLRPSYKFLGTTEGQAKVQGVIFTAAAAIQTSAVLTVLSLQEKFADAIVEQILRAQKRVISRDQKSMSLEDFFRLTLEDSSTAEACSVLLLSAAAISDVAKDDVTKSLTKLSVEAKRLKLEMVEKNAEELLDTLKKLSDLPKDEDEDSPPAKQDKPAKKDSHNWALVVPSISDHLPI